MQVASSENNVIQQPSTLGNFSLESRLVQVLRTSLNNLLLMVLDATEMSIQLVSDLCDARAQYLRPVELAKLHKTELDIASLVLDERLARGGNARGDGVRGGELQIKDLVASHGC